MVVERHDPDTVPSAVGGYSQAVEIREPRRLLHVSGQIPEAPGQAPPAGFEAQCRQAWRNLLAVVAAAGMAPADLLKVTTFLTDRGQADANGSIRREMLGAEVRPALTVVVVATLDSAWLLEIEAVAAR